MKNPLLISALLVFGMLIMGAQWNNIWQISNTGAIKIGAGSTGTPLTLIEAHNITFAGHTSRTASSSAGSTYYIAQSWKTSSADPGKITTAISAGTLTVTTANATTGTCSVMVYGAP